MYLFTQATKLLAGLIPQPDEKGSSGQLSRDHYERLYIFTVMWSVGAFLELDDRAKLEEFMRKSEEWKLDLPQIPEGFDATMFDYMVDADGKLYFKCKACKTFHLPFTQFHMPLFVIGKLLISLLIL